MILSTVAVGLLSAAWTAGQEPPKDVELVERLERIEPATAPVRQMAEDIEIMRRILDRAVQKSHHAERGTRVNEVTFSPDGKLLASGTSEGVVRLWDAATGKQLLGSDAVRGHESVVLGGAQGTYLNGYGVVYTMTILPTSQPMLPAPAQPTAKPPSEWERTRKELRGEKSDPHKAAQAPQTSLADVLLKVLAENGQHFTQLAEDERLSVVVTLPPTQACAQCHEKVSAGVIWGDVRTRQAVNWLRAAAEDQVTEWTQRKNGDAKLTQLDKDLQSNKMLIQKQVLLGDLHAKQGQYHEAADTYLAAFQAYVDLRTRKRRADLDVRGQPVADRELDLAVVSVLTKLAQTHLALGNKEKALEFLETAGRYARRTEEAMAPDKALKTKDELALPAKLTVSAPKKLLVLVGSGKITFEQFRKDATVDYLSFPAPTKHPPIK
jgi:tetratricopeptide (TPR) repeat protein